MDDLQVKPLEDDLEELDEELDDIVELGSSNAVHDRTQFESKFDFDLTSPNKDVDTRGYEIDMYLFIPKTMGIEAESYPRENFYADLTHLLRVRTPQLERPAHGVFSVPELASAEEYLRSHLDPRRRKQLQRLVIQDVRVFGCLVHTELKKFQTDIVRAQKAESTRATMRLTNRLSRRIEAVHHEIRNFRDRYVWRIRHEPLLLDEEVKKAFLLVDEYLSYRLEATLVSLHKVLQPTPQLYEDALNQIEAILTGEMGYREGLGIRDAQGPQAAVTENHYYRLGLLKKYVAEVLFLQTRRVKRDYIYKNAIAALGASLAAAFATLAQLSTMQYVAGQNVTRLMVFLGLATVAYVFKDRIKDLTKEYFNNRVKMWLPDYDVQMFYHHFDPAGQEVQTHLGDSQEYTRYLTRDAVPPDIFFVRELGHQAQIVPERKETVIHYNKKMSFHLREEVREHFGAQVRRIHDVLRFNISRFLLKLDDPRKRLSFFSEEGNVITIEAPKVYHVNLVFRYTVTQLVGKRLLRREVEYERIRLILNKKGIVRVETVVNRGRVGYSEGTE